MSSSVIVQTVKPLAAGNVRAPLGGYVLGRSGGISGQGWGGQTIVRPLPGDVGPIVSSEGLAKWQASSGKGRWAFESVPTGLYVGNFLIDAGGNVYHDAHLHDKRPSLEAAAVDLYAPGSDVEKVKVFDYPGLAFRFDQGSTTLNGQTHATDGEQTRLVHLRTLRAHSGVQIKHGADGIADDWELYEGRDIGADFQGNAWLISRIHVAGYNAKPTKENPDLGVGIRNGQYLNYYGRGIQADNCRVGFRNYGWGTSIDQLISKYCAETTLDVLQRIRVAEVSIETPGGLPKMPHFNPAPRCIVIHPTAPGSLVGNDRSEWSTGNATAAVMAVVQASQCEVRNAKSSWGGGGQANANTCVEFGSAAEELWGCNVDVWASGFRTGVKLTHRIGKGNTFTVRHNGTCDVPIDLGPNQNLAGNTVRIENVAPWAGTSTALATMEQSK